MCLTLGNIASDLRSLRGRPPVRQSIAARKGSERLRLFFG